MKLLKIGLALLGSLFPLLAVAEIFTPFENNGSVALLTDMFGSLVSNQGDSAGAFGDMFLILNNAILSLAGVFASWSLITSITDTANHGAINGTSAQSKFWYPLRLVTFTALIVPMKAGFCFIQVFVMWGILQGEGLADALWSNWVKTGSTKVIVANPSVAMLARHAFMIQVCQEASKDVKARTPQEIMDTFPYYQMVDTDGDGRMIYNSLYRYEGCGTVDFSKDGTPQTIGQDVTKVATDWFNFNVPETTAIKTAHIKGTQEMLAAFQPIAAKIVNREKQEPKATMAELTTGFSAAYKDAVTKYQSTVLAASKDISAKAVKDATTDEGWYTAGLYTLKLARIQNALSTAIGDIPAIEGPKLPQSPLDNYANTLELAKIILGRSAETRRSGISGLGDGSSVSESNTGAVGRFLASAVTGLDLQTLEYNDQNPLLFAESLGDRLFTSSEVMVGALVAASILEAGVNSLTPVESNVVGAITPLVTTFIVLFAVLGFTLQYLIVNVPAITFMFTSFWFHIVVFETLLAAPLLFAIQLGSKDETGMVGSARQSMLLLVRVMFYPFLMIAGLICAQVISQLFLQGFVNPLFAKSLLANMDGAIGLKAFFEFIAGTIILCIVYLGILKKAYSLINILPDNILEFLGSRGQLGQHGAEGAQALQTGTLAVSQNLHSIAGSAGKVAGARVGTKASKANDGVKEMGGELAKKQLE